MGLRLYSGFVEGETIELHDRDGEWRWAPWAAMTRRDPRKFGTASEAAKNAMACAVSERNGSRDALIDALRGVLEVSEGVASPEFDRARTVIEHARMSGDGGLAYMQRRTLRQLGLRHRDGMLFVRRTMGELPQEFLLVELRRGALPPLEARPSQIERGAALHYEEAHEEPLLSGETSRLIFKRSDEEPLGGMYGYCASTDDKAAADAPFGNLEDAVHEAIYDARRAGFAKLTLSGDWILDGAVDYGRIYGMDVSFKRSQA